MFVQLTNDIHLSIQRFTKENSVEHIRADNVGGGGALIFSTNSSAHPGPSCYLGNDSLVIVSQWGWCWDQAIGIKCNNYNYHSIVGLEMLKTIKKNWIKVLITTIDNV